jgi:hypothetical protein
LIGGDGLYSVEFLNLQKERMDVGMLFSTFGLMAFSIFSTVVVPVSIIAGVCLAVAALVISIGEWKIRMGLFPRFKSLTAPRYERHNYRSSLLKLKDRSKC